jgi:hypothetical protein
LSFSSGSGVRLDDLGRVITTSPADVEGCRSCSTRRVRPAVRRHRASAALRDRHVTFGDDRCSFHHVADPFFSPAERAIARVHSHDEARTTPDEVGEDPVTVTFPIHHVDGACVVEGRFDLVDEGGPAKPFVSGIQLKSEPAASVPLGLPRALLDHAPQHPERCPGTITTVDGERKVAVEPETLALADARQVPARGLPEVEFGGVVGNDEPARLTAPPYRLPHVRSQYGARRGARVVQEAVGCFQLRIVRRSARETHLRSTREPPSY